MKKEKSIVWQLIKDCTEPFLYIVPIVFIVMSNYFQMNLFIPQLGIKLNPTQFTVAVRIFIILWVCFAAAEKAYNSYSQHFARNLLPVEIIMLFFTAQHHFALAAAVFGISVASPIFWAVAVKKALPEKPASARHIAFKRISVQAASIILILPLVIGLYCMLAEKSLANSSLGPKSMEYPAEYGLGEDIANSLAVFGEESWETMFLDEKMDALQHLLNLEAAYLKIEPMALKTAELGEDTVALCYFDHGIVYISFEHLKDGEPLDCIEIICHEAYHAYQHTVVGNLDFADDFVNTSPYFENARKWRDNFENYISHGAEYYSQPIETDAFSYGKIRSDFYIEQIFG